MALFPSAEIHHGDGLFSINSRGKNVLLIMSLSARRRK